MASDSEYRLFFGDCIDLMHQIPDGIVDMVLCDLPYGITRNKWDAVIPFGDLWEAYHRVCKENAVVALFASQPFSSALVMSNPKEFRHEWIWIKNRGSNFANTVREPMKEHEHVLIFSKGKWTYNKQMQRRADSKSKLFEKDNQRKISVGQGVPSSTNYGKFNKPKPNIGELRVPTSWQKFNCEVGYHSTQKPVSLCEYLIRTYTNEGEVVLDNTMGSGSSGVAAINIGRKFIGIE